MSDFNQDIQNLLNAYDSNWDDYLVLRKQFIEKYSISVEKIQEQLQYLAEENERLRNALEDIRTNTPIQELLDLPFGCSCHEIASKALAAIGGDDE